MFSKALVLTYQTTQCHHPGHNINPNRAKTSHSYNFWSKILIPLSIVPKDKSYPWHILDLDTRWRKVINLTLWLLNLESIGRTPKLTWRDGAQRNHEEESDPTWAVVASHTTDPVTKLHYDFWSKWLIWCRTSWKTHVSEREIRENMLSWGNSAP
jgi:hypothetical protein